MMKTTDFIGRVDELGYGFGVNPYCVTIHGGDDELIIARVYEYSINRIDTSWDEDISTELFDLCVEYARTPIDERIEEEKYIWKLRGNNKENFGIGFYFNFDTENCIWFVTDKLQTSEIKTQFTEKEFAEFEEKFNIKGVFIKEKVNDK